MKLKSILLLFAAALIALPRAVAQPPVQAKGRLVITDYIKNDGKKDVSDAIQKVIDKNPNRTIYFPDGTYMISKPILTPADPRKSVSLLLSSFAVIRATPDWTSDEAMIRLGARVPFNNITLPGSNYYLEGGVIDGNKVAKGVSIDSGRETAVRNVSIKNVTLGLHIKSGANSTSADADINGVNIVGIPNGKSVGVLIEACDNTLTNMRIGCVHTGVIIRKQANYLRNIHPLWVGNGPDYETSCGFLDESGSNNWYDFCYSDEFAHGFILNGNGCFTLTNCFVYWYSKRGDKHVALKINGPFNSTVQALNVGMDDRNVTKENKIIEVSQPGGTGSINRLWVTDRKVLTDNSHEIYLTR